MRETMLQILSEIRPDIDFEAEKRLVSDKLLDSFDIITIVSEFNEAFDVDIYAEDLVEENFDSVEGMLALVESLQDA